MLIKRTHWGVINIASERSRKQPPRKASSQERNALFLSLSLSHSLYRRQLIVRMLASNTLRQHPTSHCPPSRKPPQTAHFCFYNKCRCWRKSVCWCLPCFWPFELDSRNVGLGYSQEVWPHFGVCSRILDLEVHEIYFVLKINTWNDISQNFLVFSTSGKLYAQNTLMIMTDLVLTSCSS